MYFLPLREPSHKAFIASVEMCSSSAILSLMPASRPSMPRSLMRPDIAALSSCLELLDDPARGRARGVVLLPGHEVAVLHNMHAPRRRRLIDRTGQAKAVREEPGGVAGEGGLGFLLVAEAGETSGLKG